GAFALRGWSTSPPPGNGSVIVEWASILRFALAASSVQLELSLSTYVGGANVLVERRMIMLRKQFLLSGATICLMLTSGLVYAQSPGGTRRDEPTRERLEKSEPTKAGESRSEGRPQERTRERSETNSEQKNTSARQTGEERRPSPSAQR